MKLAGHKFWNIWFGRFQHFKSNIFILGYDVLPKRCSNIILAKFQPNLWSRSNEYFQMSFIHAIWLQYRLCPTTFMYMCYICVHSTVTSFSLNLNHPRRARFTIAQSSYIEKTMRIINDSQGKEVRWSWLWELNLLSVSLFRSLSVVTQLELYNEISLYTF